MSRHLTHSPWAQTPDEGLDPTLPRTIQDVCVVGAGIAGLSVAVCLAREGIGVLVLDRVGVGAGESRRSSAHLSFVLDDRYFVLEKLHGQEAARQAMDSHRAAVDWIEDTVRSEGIDCGFERVDGYLLAARISDSHLLEREQEAAKRAGLASRWCRSGVPNLAGDGPALAFSDQAQFDPARYLDGLAAHARRLGVRICGPVDVVGVSGGDTVCVELGDGTRIECAQVVLASNVPFHARLSMHTKQSPYRTHVIAASIPRADAPPGLVWDTASPYHYVRTAPAADGDPDRLMLIVGGADEKTGQSAPEARPHGQLLDWARHRFSHLGPVSHAWSGQVIEPADGLGYAGHAPDAEGVYLVTGDSGNGLTHGTLAGTLIADLIQRRENRFEALYSPSRKLFSGTGRWVRQNANVAAQYRDWVTPAAPEHAPGTEHARPPAHKSGRVWRDGIHLVATSCDSSGREHAFSARCPHMGCAVRWNPNECSWDCPCHGSRFHPVDGRVINGPATAPLAPYPPPSSAER